VVEVGVEVYGKEGIRKIEEERMRLQGEDPSAVKAFEEVCFLRESQQNEVEAAAVLFWKLKTSGDRMYLLKARTAGPRRSSKTLGASIKSKRLS